MADDVLSQAEVESLLSTIDSGALRGASAMQPPAGREPTNQPQGPVLPYDFKRPQRVGREALRALQALHESFTRSFAAELSALLRTSLQVKLAGVDQLTYGAYFASLENPTCVCLVPAEPQGPRLILEIDPSILFPLIDRLLGGGQGGGAFARRPLTEIEQRLATRIAQLFLSELRKAWAHVLTLNLSVERVESNPQLVQAVPPYEVVVVICFEVALGGLSGMMNLGIPHSLVERIGGRLVSSGWLATGTSTATPETVAHLSREVGRSLLELAVTLAETKISTGDLIGLRVGDVIATDKDVRSPLQVAVEDVARFIASPGALKGHKAIQIESAAPENLAGFNLAEPPAGT
jgi:flagellar motor switch protein FliM